MFVLELLAQTETKGNPVAGALLIIGICFVVAWLHENSKTEHQRVTINSEKYRK
jgi:hypothetical protein